jgi:hypothetical protein
MAKDSNLQNERFLDDEERVFLMKLDEVNLMAL